MGYRGPFYSSSGTELGSFSGGVPRITSTEVLQQVLPSHSLTPLMLSCCSILLFVWCHDYFVVPRIVGHCFLRHGAALTRCALQNKIDTDVKPPQRTIMSPAAAGKQPISTAIGQKGEPYLCTLGAEMPRTQD